MNNFHVVILFVSLSFSALAAAPVNGIEFFKTLSGETGPKSFPLAELPHIIGGTSSSPLSGNSEKYTQLVTEIAVSDEAVFQEMNKLVFEPFEAELLKGKISTLIFSPESSSFSFETKMDSSKRTMDDISIQKWVALNSPQNASLFVAKANKFLARFKKIEFAELSPFSVKTPVSRRAQGSYQPEYFEVRVKADLRGIDKQNFRHQERFEFTMVVEKNAKSNLWTSTSFNLDSGESLTARSASFREVANVADVPPANYLRREAIRRGGYAIAMCDYDGDGVVDMFVGNMKSMEVFKGLGNGSFKKISNASLGLEDETLVKSIACNDFDNDGLKDLLIVRFAPSEEKGKDLFLYHNDGKKFVKQTSINKRHEAYYAMPSAVADFNGDGLLDFYIGFPGVKDFTVLKKNESGFTDLKEANPQGLFYNTGKFTFEDVTRDKLPAANNNKKGFNPAYPESALVFPHTSAGIDYDLDGNMDIVVIDDKANLSPLYKNTGNGNFVQVADKIGVSNYDFGMGFAAADLDNDGYMEFIYTNVNFLSTERMHNSLVNNFSDYSKLPGTYGLRIFKTKDGKNYSDVTALMGIKDAGYGLGGVEVIDYNNDGNLDFYVPNGLWSGNTKNQDISSLFSRAYSKYNYDYQEVFNSPEGIEQANSSFMRILTDYRGDVTTGKTNDKLYPSMTGFQRNRMFRNNGDGTFTDVAYMLGIDSVSDGYVVATADLNNDGKMDLILRNADPGTDKNMFPAVQVFMNESKLKNKALTLTLEGARSNRDAVGAIVEAKVNNRTLTRHLIANNGSVQSQGLIHIGLGNYAKVDILKIRWPSGAVDIYKNVPAGNRHYRESNSNITASLGN